MNHGNSTRLLECQSLAIGYRTKRTERVVLRDIDVALRPGEFVCLLGPNGVGKSTLMRTLGGMQQPLSGRVLLQSQPLAAYRPQQLARRVSIVLTERIDAAMLSAYELVALGRYPYTGWRGRLRAVDERAIHWALQSVGALDLAARHVGELSDGERQKVMVARALAQEPLIMLLDEPTAFLDLPRRVEIMQILRRLAHDEQRAVLLSTHDLDLALRTADSVWLMDGDRLTAGAPEDLVLSGAFGRAFATAGVEFDMQTGAFRMQPTEHTVVDVLGAGLAAQWAAKALTRAGYRVSQQNSGAAIRVTVLTNGATPSGWQISDAEHTLRCSSIAELLQTVDRLLAAPIAS